MIINKSVEGLHAQLSHTTLIITSFTQQALEEFKLKETIFIKDALRCET